MIEKVTGKNTSSKLILMREFLDLLHKVKWFDDGSAVAFRRSCAHGVCGSDAMVVNGENMLACQVLVKEVSNTN